MTMVLVVAAELMATVRVQGLLQRVGCPVGFAEPEVEAVRRAIATLQPRILVVDLGVSDPVRAEVFAGAKVSQVPVIAFGSHVDARGLADAKRAGAAEVLTRGALANGLAPLVAKHLARAPGIGGPDPS